MISPAVQNERHSRDGKCCDAHWYAILVEQRGLTLRGLTQRKGVLPSKLGFPVEEIMRRRGLRPFIPVESIFIRRDRYHLGVKMRVRRALLPGMVFLHLEEPVNWYRLMEMPLVRGIFGLDGSPYRFPQHGIDKLMAISANLHQPEFYRPMPTRRGYAVGDKVVDLSGVFEGELQVTAIDGEMARFLAPFFGEMREVTTQARLLAKAAE